MSRRSNWSSRMKSIYTTGFSLVVVMIATIITTQQQVASAQELETRALKVHPFDDLLHLPHNTWRTDKRTLEPALGHVSRLDIKKKPKSCKTMPTMFHVYRHDKSTRNVTFQANEPLETGAGIQGHFQYDLAALAGCGFDVTKKTVVLISGFMTSYEEKWAIEAKDVLIELLGDDVNVIIVGWPESNKSSYERAAANTVYIARQVTIFLHYLAQLGGTTLKDQDFLDRIHLVGHSLGAHISAFVGQDLGGRVGRITGLDPAGPMFDLLPVNQRLDRGDAQLVDVLHTDAGHMKYSGAFKSFFKITLPSLMSCSKIDPRKGPSYGINLQIGHIDYYANNGHDQEGCMEASNPLVINICNHGRATEIFVDALRVARDLSASAGDSRNRHLWAFRANDFADFQSGSSLERLCPQLVKTTTTTTLLEGAQVDDTCNRCAAPLLDLTTPTGELIRELRDKYHIDFDANSKSETQSCFYFRTQKSSKDSTRYLADHYLLKVHLDPRKTHWDSNECSLSAELLMQDGEKITLEVNKLESGQATLAAPFAHPAGLEAIANLQKLLAEIFKDDQVSGQSSTLFRDLFPSLISLHLDGGKTTHCQFALRKVEVAPLSVQNTQSSLSGLYFSVQDAPTSDPQLKFVGSHELAERLTVTPSVKLAQGSRIELKPNSVVI